MGSLLDPDGVLEKHLRIVQAPGFQSSLDQQQRTLEVVQDYVASGGSINDSFPDRLLEEMAAALGEGKDRLRQLTTMQDPIKLRRGLKVRTVQLGERRPEEDVYPQDGWLGAYLDYTLLTEQPMGWNFWAATTVLAAACRRNVYMDLGFEDVLFPNQYIFIVGDSGIGKNQSIQQATSVLEQANLLALGGCSERNLDCRVKVLQEATAEGIVDQIQPGLVVVDKAQGLRLERKESVGLLVNPEASTVIGKSRRESADRLIPFLTDLYDGKPKFTVTRGKGERTLGPAAFSLMLGSTEAWIRDSITESVVSGGFTGRCSFIHRTERSRIRFQDIPAGYVPDPAVQTALAKMLVPWMLAETPVEVVPTPQAQRWFEDWYVQVRKTPTPSEHLEGWWARKPAHLGKLSMALAVSQVCSPKLHLGAYRSLPLDLETMEWALALLDLEQARIPTLLSSLANTKEVREADKLWGAIQRKYAVPTVGNNEAHNDIYREVGRRWGPKGFSQLMDILVEDGRVANMPSTKGRQYRFNKVP